jgi:flagellar assembly protein FliH
MAGVIPKDKLAGYQRWSIGSLDAKPLPHGISPIEMTSASSASPTAPTSHSEAPVVQAPSNIEQIQRIHDDARANGYSLGYQEGLKAGELAMATAVTETTAQFAELIGNLQVSLAHIDQHVAEQVLSVALEVAAQVLRGAINTRPELLLPVIREALSALPLHHAHVVIHMNPADAPLIRQQIGEQLSQTGAQIIDDPEISPGGCQLVAGASEVDATIETRWRRVLESIGVAPLEWMNRL